MGLLLFYYYYYYYFQTERDPTRTSVIPFISWWNTAWRNMA